MARIPLRRRIGNKVKYMEELVYYHLSPFLYRPDKNLINEKKFFCLNSGNCGSTYIVKLLQKNGVSGCKHELRPDFNLIGANIYESGSISEITQKKLIRMLRFTRRDILFEANNRFFSMTPLLKSAFPNAKFIFLHRDGRETVQSIISRPYLTDYFNRSLAIKKILKNHRNKSNFEKACHFWDIRNRTIYNDLQKLAGQDYLNLPFNHLVEGKLEELEDFINIDLNTKAIQKVNASTFDKGITFDSWTKDRQQSFWDICGDTMKKLGYS